MDSDLATPHPPGSTPQAQPWLPAESRALFTNNAFLELTFFVFLVFTKAACSER